MGFTPFQCEVMARELLGREYSPRSLHMMILLIIPDIVQDLGESGC